METIGELARIAALDIGVNSFDPSETNARNERGLARGDLVALAAVITKSSQTLFDKAPGSVSERQKGFALRAPTTVSLTVTQYSNTIAFTAGYASWMLGCTISIAGDGIFNEVVTSTSLLRPFMGTSGTFSATVWCDAIALDSTIKNVVGPVWVPNRAPLSMAIDREQFLFGLIGGSAGAVSSFPPGYSSNQEWNNNKTVQDPQLYLVESVFTDNSTELDQTVVAVSGGSSPYNGTYQEVGTYNSHTLYAKGGVNEAASPCIAFHGGLWKITTLSAANTPVTESFQYVSTGGDQSFPWTTSGYDESVANPPGPTVSPGITPGGVALYLRLNPMPGVAMPLTAKVKLNAPHFTLGDICTDFDGGVYTDPGTPIPIAIPHTTLLSFVRKAWLSHPRNVLDAGQRTQIVDDYNDAKQALAGLRPSSGRVRGVYR